MTEEIFPLIHNFYWIWKQISIIILYKISLKLIYEVRSESFETVGIKTRTLISGIKVIHHPRRSSPGSEHNDPSAAAKPESIPGNHSLSACQAPSMILTESLLSSQISLPLAEFSSLGRKISRDASKLGSGAGIVVFTPRGTTSRVMDEFNT
jgi:hypothetical protein